MTQPDDIQSRVTAIGLVPRDTAMQYAWKSGPPTTARRSRTMNSASLGVRWKFCVWRSHTASASAASPFSSSVK